MQILSTEIRSGDVVKVAGGICKVQSLNLHTGGGKTGAMVHMKLRNLGTGAVIEQRFATTEKLEKLDVERVPMEYLYSEGDSMVFMHPTSFEQCRLAKNSVGPAADLFKEGDTLHVELFEGNSISLNLPEAIELAVSRTGPGLRGDTTYKEAELENGLTILVPQFIKTGDVIRVSVESREYIDRAHEKEEKPVYKTAKKKEV